MKRRTINLRAGDDMEWAEATETTTAFAEAVVTETPGYDRVFISGLTARAPDLAIGPQTRDILEQIESNLDVAGGTMQDVVRVRVYVEEPYLTREHFQAIHEARGEFFAPDAYPASTLVEVSGLIRAGRHIEIDADAIIPKEPWRLDTVDKPE